MLAGAATGALWKCTGQSIHFVPSQRRADLHVACSRSATNAHHIRTLDRRSSRLDDSQNSIPLIFASISRMARFFLVRFGRIRVEEKTQVVAFPVEYLFTFPIHFSTHIHILPPSSLMLSERLATFFDARD